MHLRFDNTTDPSTKLIQGQEIPALGFGTYELSGQACKAGVETALMVGYRHIDTARAYGNEKQVGEAIRQSDVKRSEIFLTSKIWWDDLAPSAVRESVLSSLKDLKTDYLDLALVHWPNPDIPLEQTIDALIELRREKLIRNFGVSNFTPPLLQKAMSCGLIFCNQVEYHPFLEQTELLHIAQSNDILLTAYAPLAQGEAINVAALNEIGEKYGKSGEQVALRWLIEQDNVAAIPRSSKVEHIRSNFDIFNFELDANDRAHIASLPKNKRQINPDFAPNWH